MTFLHSEHSGDSTNVRGRHRSMLGWNVVSSIVRSAQAASEACCGARGDAAFRPVLNPVAPSGGRCTAVYQCQMVGTYGAPGVPARRARWDLAHDSERRLRYAGRCTLGRQAAAAAQEVEKKIFLGGSMFAACTWVSQCIPRLKQS